MARPRGFQRAKAQVNHDLGLPSDDPPQRSTRSLLPRARILLLMSSPSEEALLYRYADDGSYAGDTWHPNVEEAEEQALFEFSEALQEWREIPAAEADAHSNAWSQL